MKLFILYFVLLCTFMQAQVVAQNTLPQYVKTGKIYHSPPRVINSSPYFKNTGFTKGTIVYDKVKYENQTLLYDVTSDKLVVEDVNYIHVVKSLVAYFSVNGDTIIYKAGNDRGIPEGYYEKVYNSESSSGLARHSKYLKEVMRGTMMERMYQENVRYYVLWTGFENYKELRNEKDLLHLHKNLKKEAKALLRSRSLKFKTRPKETIQTVLQFYENHI